MMPDFSDIFKICQGLLLRHAIFFSGVGGMRWFCPSFALIRQSDLEFSGTGSNLGCSQRAGVLAA